LAGLHPKWVTASEAALRFFFHVVGGVPVRDRYGVELPDISAARAEAVNYALNLSGLQLGLSGRPADGHVVVADEHGHELLTIPLSDEAGRASD
jgi:hypothetical protein